MVLIPTLLKAPKEIRDMYLRYILRMIHDWVF